MNLERIGLWPARAIWLLTPLMIGPALVRALEDRASTPGLIVEIALWVTWFAVLVAVLTPSPVSLTISRVAGPAAVGAVVLAGVAVGFHGPVVLGLGFGALFTAAAFLPTFGDRMINGSAYGSERRMVLRPPAFVMLGPVQLAWLLVFAGLTAGPLLILSERYVAAVAAVAAGAAGVWTGGRVLHQLARRWVVFVPAGFVIRDPMILVDSVLLRRSEVVALGPALVGGGHRRAANALDIDAEDDRIDLSGGALGLALEVALKEATPITIRQRRQLRNQDVSNIVFSPTLPGAMLSEARIRGMKIGEAPVET